MHIEAARNAAARAIVFFIATLNLLAAENALAQAPMPSDPANGWTHRDMANVRFDENITVDGRLLSKAQTVWEKSFLHNNSRYTRFAFDSIKIGSGANFKLQIILDPIDRLLEEHDASALSRSDSLMTGLLPPGNLRARIIAQPGSGISSLRLVSFGWQTGATALRQESAVSRSNPIQALQDADPMKLLAASVVMLHIGPEGTTCTGAMIGPDLIATNHHCMEHSLKFLKTESSGRGDCSDTLVEFDYLSEGATGLTTPCIEVRNSHEKPDLAIIRASIPPTRNGQARRPLPLGTAPLAGNADLFIMHHPLGMPMVYETHCQLRGQQGAEYLHNCQTDSGSSGSPLFSSENDSLVAIHYFGPYPRSWTIEQVEDDKRKHGPRYNKAIISSQLETVSKEGP